MRSILVRSHRVEIAFWWLDEQGARTPMHNKSVCWAGNQPGTRTSAAVIWQQARRSFSRKKCVQSCTA